MSIGHRNIYLQKMPGLLGMKTLVPIRLVAWPQVYSQTKIFSRTEVLPFRHITVQTLLHCTAVLLSTSLLGYWWEILRLTFGAWLLPYTSSTPPTTADTGHGTHAACHLVIQLFMCDQESFRSLSRDD